MLRNVSLLTRRKKTELPSKLTKPLSPVDQQSQPQQPNGSLGMSDRSTNPSSFFPSHNPSMANLPVVSTPIVGRQVLSRGVASVPGADVPTILPKMGDEVDGSAKTWNEALINVDLAGIATQLKNEAGCDIDRDIDDVRLRQLRA